VTVKAPVTSHEVRVGKVEALLHRGVVAAGHFGAGDDAESEGGAGYDNSATRCLSTTIARDVVRRGHSPVLTCHVLRGDASFGNSRQTRCPQTSHHVSCCPQANGTDDEAALGQGEEDGEEEFGVVGPTAHSGVLISLLW
jgi:hypothetical protein